MLKENTLHSGSHRILRSAALFIVLTLIAPRVKLLGQACSGTTPCVLTGQYGPLRQAYNPNETVITPSNASSLAEVSWSPLQLTSDTLTGGVMNEVFAQPLYVAGISTSLANCTPSCNMLVVGTLSSSLWAWNADTGAVVWKRTTQTTGGAQTTNLFWYDDCTSFGSLATPPAIPDIPYAGIVATPVIDVTGSHPVMFVTSLCQTSATQGNQQWWIHKIDLTTGYDVTTAQQVGATPPGADAADDLSGSTIAFTGWEVMQRSALLEVSNPNTGSPARMVYAAFGSAVNETAAPYHGWIFGYGPSLGTALVSFVTSAKGASGNTDLPACSANCTLCTPYTGPGSCGVAGKPACCSTQCVPAGYVESPNECGHGGGAWMSARGPASNTFSNGTTNVAHAFFGIGNGPYQQYQSDGVTLLSPVQNWGNSVVDFTLSGSSYSTYPASNFTPSGGRAVEPPAVGVSYTYQGLNQNDFDMATSGILLFDDLSGNHRLVTVDKAGYGYLLKQGNLCGQGNSSGSGPENGTCGTSPGLTPTDYGDIFPFGASSVLCADQTDPDMCDRVTSLAFYKDGSTERLYFWPNDEVLAGFQLSNNSAVSGTGTVSAASGSTTVTGASTVFTQQIVVGDQITAGGQTAVVTAVASDTSLTVNQAFSPGLSGASFTYNGYFINPIYDTHPMGDNVGFPGGSVLVTANGSSGAVVWGLATLDTGGATLFAYNSALSIAWCSNAMSYCSNSSYQTKFTQTKFSMPTVVNAYAYIPTGGIQQSSQNSTCTSTAPCSGLLVYHLPH